MLHAGGTFELENGTVRDARRCLICRANWSDWKITW